MHEFDDTSEKTRWEMVTSLQKILFSITEHILDKQSPVLVIKCRTSMHSNHEGNSLRRAKNNVNIRQLTFPSTPEGSWRFVVYVRIIEILLEALQENKFITKRDIYYRDVELFRSQSIVNSTVDTLSYTLNAQRDSLHVISAAKGILYGPIDIIGRNGFMTKGDGQEDGIFVPSNNVILQLQLRTPLDYILIIEKEATFRSLVRAGFAKSSHGLLITGKGYPDVATREFLFRLNHVLQNHLNPALQKLSIYGLVDYDPHGLEIMSVYINGSSALAHETHRLAVAGIKWVGIKPQDVPINEWLSLTSTDRRKAFSLLASPVMQSSVLRVELCRMLMLNRKAEIQSVEQQLGLQTLLRRQLLISTH